MEYTNVWIVTYNFGSVKAGPVLRFLRYAPYFHQNGVKITFITKDRGEKDTISSDFNVEYLECKNVVELTKLAILKAKSVSNQPKAILFLSVEYANFFDFFAAKNLGIKLVYVSTMQFNLRKKEFGSDRSILAQIVLFILMHFTLNLFDEIICSTNFLLEDFKKLLIRKKKLRIIYNGVDTEKFKPINESEKNILRVELGLPINIPIVLFVGLFVERKGVDYLINLFQNSEFLKSNAKLLLVGDEMLNINENSLAFKKSWPSIREKGLEDDFLIIHPFNSSIQNYFKVADIFVFPSKLEGMPNVLLEAMASGICVLLNKFDGFSDDYGQSGFEYDTLIYDMDNDINLIKKYLNDDNLRNKLGLNATIHAKENFAINKSINSYLRLFK
jgi:glycosyltransferase involved in cell wall biosynthesis